MALPPYIYLSQQFATFLKRETHFSSDPLPNLIPREPQTVDKSQRQTAIMSTTKRGVTLIGSNFKVQASDDSADGSTATTQPAVPLCTSKICTVKAPHAAKPYVSTTTGLPGYIKTLEAKALKSKHDIWILDIFYTVHWDHVNRPLPAPIKECVDKTCFVRARHAAKVYSKNPQKADRLPVIVQQVQTKKEKTQYELRGLENFWRIHGPVVAASMGGPSK